MNILRIRLVKNYILFALLISIQLIYFLLDCSFTNKSGYIGLLEVTNQFENNGLFLEILILLFIFDSFQIGSIRNRILHILRL